MPPVNLLIKPASGLCNMHCDYCFYCDITEKRKQASYGIMSEKTLENVIKKALRFAEGSCTIAYQGGEPTLAGLDFFKKSIDLQNFYNRKGVRIENALQTNGFDLNEEWCSFFRDNHFLIGLSIDGVEETHNAYRHDRQGKGSYKRILESAGMLEKWGVDFNILTVVNRRTAKNIKKIYQSYASRGFMYQQYIACLDPIGEENGGREYSLLPEDYGTFLIQLFELWYRDFQKGKQPYIRQFENYISILLGYGAESCEQRGTCGCQNVVEADGSVYPCDFYVLDAYRLGSLNEVSMQDIYRRRDEIQFIEQSYHHSEACKACGYFELCRGGCRRNRFYDESQSGFKNYFCTAYKMFFGACKEKLCHAAEITGQRIGIKR